MAISGLGQPSKGTGGSPRHVVAVVRLLAARCRLVVVMGRYDVAGRLNDVSDESGGVSKARLLMLALKLASFVRAKLLQPALTVLLYQYLMTKPTIRTVKTMVCKCSMKLVFTPNLTYNMFSRRLDMHHEVFNFGNFIYFMIFFLNFVAVFLTFQ